jgi:hypothetical protein
LATLPDPFRPVRKSVSVRPQDWNACWLATRSVSVRPQDRTPSGLQHVAASCHHAIIESHHHAIRNLPSNVFDGNLPSNVFDGNLPSNVFDGNPSFGMFDAIGNPSFGMLDGNPSFGMLDGNPSFGMLDGNLPSVILCVCWEYLNCCGNQCITLITTSV